jgi:hypothetical protein
LPSEVAEANLDGAEQLSVRGIDQGIDHLVDQGQGLGQEVFAEALAALVAGFGPFGGR